MSDVDLLEYPLAGHEFIPEDLCPHMYAGDTTFCHKYGSHIYWFMNCGQGVKGYLGKFITNSTWDVQDIAKYDDVIFYRLENNTYVTIASNEDNGFLFTTVSWIRNVIINSGRMVSVRGRNDKSVAKYGQNQNVFTAYNNYQNVKNSIEEIFDALDFSRPLMNRDVSLERVCKPKEPPIIPVSLPLPHPEDDGCELPRNTESYSTQDGDRGQYGGSNSSTQTDGGVRVTSASYPPENTVYSISTVVTSATNTRHHGTIPPNRQTTAKYPEFADKHERLVSFSRWMYERIQDPTRLANFGFFYTGQHDLVRCFQCGLGLKDFTNTDVPLCEHVKHSGTCEFLVRLLGTEKLQQMKTQLANTDVNYMRQQQWLQLQRRTNGAAGSVPSPDYRHPKYASIQSRLQSYDLWTARTRQTPWQLADAGFFYKGDGDTVRCFACDGGLRNWDPQDDPWIEHCRWFPACPYAFSTKGENYIRLVQTAAATGIEDGLRGLHSPAPRTQLEPNPNDASTQMNNLTLTGGEEPHASTNYVQSQLMDMGYKDEEIQTALSSLAGKGNTDPDIMAFIDEIEDIRKTKEDKPWRINTEKQKSENKPETLRQENERLKTMTSCTGCKTSQREVLFLPCKHLRMCVRCADTMIRCPSCKEPILHKIRTFVA